MIWSRKTNVKSEDLINIVYSIHDDCKVLSTKVECIKYYKRFILM